MEDTYESMSGTCSFFVVVVVVVVFFFLFLSFIIFESKRLEHDVGRARKSTRVSAVAHGLLWFKKSECTPEQCLDCKETGRYTHDTQQSREYISLPQGFKAHRPTRAQCITCNRSTGPQERNTQETDNPPLPSTHLSPGVRDARRDKNVSGSSLILILFMCTAKISLRSCSVGRSQRTCLSKRPGRKRAWGGRGRGKNHYTCC